MAPTASAERARDGNELGPVPARLLWLFELMMVSGKEAQRAEVVQLLFR